MIRTITSIYITLMALVISGCAPGTMETRQRTISSPLERQVKAQQLRITAMEQQLATLSEAQREQDVEYEKVMQRLDAVLAEISQARKDRSGGLSSSGDGVISPQGDSTTDASGQQGQDPGQRTPTEIYRRAFAAYTTGKHAQAQELFEEFATSFPDNDYVANARFWQGEACLAQGMYTEAEKAFAAVEEFDPQSTKVPFAKLKQGLIRARQGDTQGARTLLEDVQRNYPDTEAAEQAEAALNSGRLN